MWAARPSIFQPAVRRVHFARTGGYLVLAVGFALWPGVVQLGFEGASSDWPGAALETPGWGLRGGPGGVTV